MVRRVSLVFLLLVVCIIAWHGSLLASLLRPTLQAVHALPADTRPIGPDEFTYDRLGIRAPLSVDAGTSPLVESDWSKIREALMHGVSLSYGGEQFSDASLVFVTGHSSDTTSHEFDSVFAALGQAAVGDTFAFTVAGSQYRYQVVDKRQIRPWDTAAFEALAPADASHRVALVTCWPPLTTQTRMVVIGTRL